jgi:hypothetical protein
LTGHTCSCDDPFDKEQAMFQDRAMLGKKAPRTQQALRRIAGAIPNVGASVPEFLTTAERLLLANPDEHRLVYDTDMSLLMLWDGSTWQVI